MKNKLYTKTVLKGALVCLFVLGVFQLTPALAQVTLSGSSYTENFDGMGSGTTPPTGWTARTGATASARGSAVAALSTNSVTFTTGAFNNYQNGTGRCLGVRQSTSLGDPGASFELEIANTTGKTGFSISMEHLMLDVETRSTTWTIQYSTNGTSWTNIGSYTDPGVLGTSSGSYSLGTGLDNQSGTVYIRIAALTGSTGGGSRDTYGIDNISLTWTNGGSSCAVPTSLLKSNIKDTSVTLSWTSPGGSLLGYEYAVTGSVTPPASGTFVSDTFVTATQLTFSTKYYVHLRTKCSGSDFSSWITDSTTTALPVELIGFSAKPANSAVELKWSTAQEINNNHFEIERSEDGKNFRRISSVKGKGTYRGVSGYAYTDTDPAGDKIYYRLKQVDFDGSYAYSEVVAAVRTISPQKSLDNLSVYPNPVTKESGIHYVLHSAAKVNVIIYNVLGEPVKQVVNAEQQEGAYEYTMPELKPGVYFIQLGIDQYAKAIRIIVE